MYDPRDPPDPVGVPPPPPARSPPQLQPMGPRYAYLATRLRNRQITMEEATELFGIMQESLATAGQAIRQMVPPPPPRSSPRTERPSAPSQARIGLTVSDDDIALGILALGVGAGLLAAILKRSAEGPRATGSK